MSDLISRAVAMDAIQDAMPVDPMTGSEITKERALRLAQVCITLNRLLSAHPELDTGMYADGFADGYRQGKKDAQPEQRWIPCSERYPDMDERVLVYTVAHDYHVWDCMSNRADNYFWEDEEGLYHDKYEADLWMPLPDPWRGEEHDEMGS